MTFLLAYLSAEYDFETVLSRKSQVIHFFPFCSLPPWRMGKYGLGFDINIMFFYILTLNLSQACIFIMFWIKWSVSKKYVTFIFKNVPEFTGNLCFYPRFWLPSFLSHCLQNAQKVVSHSLIIFKNFLGEIPSDTPTSWFVLTALTCTPPPKKSP